MDQNSNSKILGASIVGIAIVAGAFIANRLSEGVAIPAEPNLYATVNTAPARTVLPVVDTDGNGIEDWQEELLPVKTIETPTAASAAYIPPDTLTGQFGINIMENILITKTAGGINETSENRIINTTINNATNQAGDKYFNITDIKVSSDISGPAIRNYANAMALAFTGNSIKEQINEIDILRKSVSINGPQLQEKDIADLKLLTQMYKGTRDDFLKIPVPSVLIKQHLDLTNVVHSLYKDVEGFTKIDEDPLLSLIRLNRYQDDVEGLRFALENIYNAAVPYSSFIQKDDPAVFFINFSPEFKR